MIYLICYAFVGFLMTNIDKHDNKLNRFILFLSISILTILATFRDETIGSDVRGYALLSFQSAECVTDIKSFFSYIDSGTEHSYRLLVFFVRKYSIV